MKQTVKLVTLLAAGCSLLLAPGVARSEPAAREHTVRSGDNLHLIAGYYYKDPRQWKRIWKANRKTIASPSHLKVGKVLKIEADTGWDIPYEEYLAKVRGK